MLKLLRNKIAITSVIWATLGVSPVLAQFASSHTPSMQTPSGSATQAVAISATGKVVARVNGVALTDGDLVRKMNVIFPYAKQHNGGFPRGMESEIRHGAMKMIVFEELCYQEAVRRNMSVAPARVTKLQNEIRTEMKDPRAYQALLNDQGNGTEAGLRKRIVRMLLVQDLMKAEISDKSVITPLKLRAYYNQNLEKFRVAETVSFQSISVVPPAGSNAEAQAEAKKRAQSALQQAKAADSYEKFGLLAEKLSDDDFRVNMGYRKPVEVAKLPPAIAKLLTSMKPGQVSDIVNIDGGYTILRLIDHNPPTTRKFLDVKTELKKHLEEQKQEELRSALNERLRAKAKVEEL